METGTEALATTRPQRSLAEKLRQEGNEDGTEMAFLAELVRHLDRLENELRRNAVSEESRKWLAQCGLTAEQMAGQLDAQTEPERKVHLYHCDHRGLPVALINSEGARDWSAEYDVWGNRLKEDNPQKLAQLIRLPGQQYDDETGLYYNRYRYYNPEQGRYISQDPIGLRGGWNLYTYPLNPVSGTDPLGLFVPLVIAGYYISAEVVALASSGLAAVTAALSTPSGQQVVQNAANAISNTYYQIASQAMIENPGLIAFVAGQTATGRSLVDSGNAMADSYQSIFSDPCGAFASVFGDDNSTNPNVGKDLTDEEKNELGGAGSGSPNGWGPEDEENARGREDNEADIIDKLNPVQRSSVNKLHNIIENNLTEGDFSGTLADLQGNPIPKPGGGFWDHLTEMKQSYDGLNSVRTSIDGTLRNPNLDPQIRTFLEGELSEANLWISKIEDLFKPFGGVK
ncbi:hypothetical protein DO967_21555 [Salmonella enterica subsp. salamae]|nr:hypothetical protein [Salmonella enterica subsp. salamae]ECG1232071.1 hypothetical protein [Salmonella enterica subsp. salamae]